MLFDPKWQAPVNSPVADVLTRARCLIEDPSNWCQKYEDGHAICAIHAIQRALADDWTEEAVTLEVDAYTALGTAMGIPEPGNGPAEGNWNDSHTHAEVLDAFDRAIAAAL